MKWIGQHIYDLVARFRNDVYLEDLSTTTETNVLVVDSDGKVSKTTVITGDVTGVTAGDNITVTNPTGPVPTVALSTNVDVAGTLDVTGLGTFDASITVAGKISLNDGGDSVFVGEYAGLNGDAGSHNVGVGYQALHALTIGQRNTAIGYKSLLSNTGSYNTAVGYVALHSNTTGSSNTALGYAALYHNLTGYSEYSYGLGCR
jgi:trimeric autotransporter adhesin